MTTFNGMIFAEPAGSGAGVSGLDTADGGTALADNAIVRGDGTTGVQGSLPTILDTGAIVLGLNGTHSAPAIKLAGGVAGLYDDWGTGGVAIEFALGTSCSLTSAGVYKLYVDGNEMLLPTGSKFGWGTIGGAHDAGLERGAAGVVHVTDGLGNPGTLRALSIDVDDVFGGDATGGTWSTSALSVYSGVIRLGAASDAGFERSAAGVVEFTDGGTGIRGLLGGGAAVASATALPVPTGRVFHVTGTTTVTSITSTNFQHGACITLIFDDVLTFTDGNNLKLAGNFVTTADDTISLCYDGTNWFETSRSVN